MKPYNTLTVFLTALLLSLTTAYAASGWQTDFEAAMTEAKQQEKHVLVNFTGSDWCIWCMRLDKEVFKQAAFKAYADDELILVEIDFPRKKSQSEVLTAQNEKLLSKYGVQGFPTILLLAPDGTLVGRTGYQSGGASAYITHLKEIISK